MLLYVIPFIFLVSGSTSQNPPYSKKEAIALVRGSSSLYGILKFEQDQSPGAPIHIYGQLTGLIPSGLHGFHVHEFGDLSQIDCTSTGEHWNPKHYVHGAPQDSIRHKGDLGNIIADNNGQAYVDIWDTELGVYGLEAALGRGIVVHQKPDDLGRGNDEESKKTGNAGARLGCGVIGLADY